MSDAIYKWKDEVGPQGYDWEKLHPQIMALGSEHNSFAYQITRAQDDNLSFSAEAIENLARGLMTFFLSRCYQRYETTGRCAQKAKVTITVELED